MQSKSCVYWIKAPHHTDIFTEGYVGVSIQGTQARWLKHLSDARNSSELPVHRAIRKYGDNLVVETVVLGSPEYCLNLEASLRPVPNVGYNVESGGGANRIGAKATAESRQRMSAHAKAVGRRPNATALANSAKTNSARTAWLCQFANKDVWKLADVVFEHMQVYPKHGYTRISTLFGTTKDQLATMFKKIKAGWNPLLDTEWLIFSGKLSPDASGDKSLQTGNSPNQY